MRPSLPPIYVWILAALLSIGGSLLVHFRLRGILASNVAAELKEAVSRLSEPTRQILDATALPVVLGILFLLTIATVNRKRRGGTTNDADEAASPEWGARKIVSDEPSRVDKLGTRPFAKGLAAQLLGIDTTDGIVFGLEGAWGSGKSTVVGFVEKELAKVETPPILICFNPWWFSGADDLRAQFFTEFEGQLDVRWWRKWSRGVGTWFLHVGRHTQDAPFDVVRLASEITRYSGRLLRNEAGSVARERDRIESLLRESPRRLVVIIEDIDRLPASEIRQTFTLIKAVANFPNTTYLLSYAHKEVTEALDEATVGQGELYLRKIVQVPIPMPAIDPARLQHWLTTELDALLSPVPEELWDRSQWLSDIRRAIEHFIRTPRDVRRYVNALVSSHIPLAEEVHAVDFWAIEALRVFVPEVHATLSREKTLLTGGRGLDRVLRDDEAARERLRTMVGLANSHDQAVAQAIIEALFPEAAQLLSGHGAGLNKAQARAARRITHADWFDVYFTRSTGEEVLRRQQILDLLNMDSKAFGEALLVYRDEDTPPYRRPRIELVLDELRALASTSKELPDIEQLLGGLAAVGDRLNDPEREGQLGGENVATAVYLANDLVDRIEDTEQRDEILTRVLSTGRAIHFRVRLFELLKEEELISGEVAHAIQEELVRGLEEAAASDELWDAPRLMGMLNQWVAYDSETTPSQYVSQLAESDEGFARLLGGLASPVWTNTEKRWRLESKWLTQFGLDASESRERAKALLEDSPYWITDQHRRGLEALLAPDRDIDSVSDGGDELG